MTYYDIERVKQLLNCDFHISENMEPDKVIITTREVYETTLNDLTGDIVPNRTKQARG